MIIETLGLRPTVRSDAEDEYPSSVSARSAASLGSSSNTSTSSKRYSNNLFGSGRFRDYSYMRSVSQAKTASMRTSDSSRTHTVSYADSMRPTTPDATSSSSPPSSPEKLAVRSAPLAAPAPYGGQPLSVAEYRLSKTLGPSVLRRASLALEEAIKAIEEEAEDEIVMPRSPPIPRGSLDTQRQSTDSVRIFPQPRRSCLLPRFRGSRSLSGHLASTMPQWQYRPISIRALTQSHRVLPLYPLGLYQATSQGCRDP
jgi:hypothetical protein